MIIIARLLDGTWVRHDGPSPITDLRTNQPLAYVCHWSTS